MVVGYQLLGRLYTVTDDPPAVATVHVVNEHLKMLSWRCRQGELQASVNRVAELPYLGLCLITVERHRVLEETAVLHLQSLRAFKRVTLILIVTVRADRYLHMLSKGEIERQVMVAHYLSVTVTVVINIYVENERACCTVNLHCSKYFMRLLFVRDLAAVAFLFSFGVIIR